ncbi:MAG TPA: zf-HC2 domain-containing protein, partial [Myxococcota bacterium]|nr:zf-HC2 domain-containing protein [Myxococcota bacterium]
MLESFAADSLEPAERDRVAEHARSCEACRTELGGLAVVRLGLTRDAAPTGEHLGDERLALLADGALPEADREQALRHLLGCPSCLGSLVALHRALAAVGEGEHVPPPALLAQAAHPGARATPSPEGRPWLAWLLGGGLGWRLAAAGAAAAAILALVVLTAGPGPSARLPGPGTPALIDPPAMLLGERAPAPEPGQVPPRDIPPAPEPEPEPVAPGPPKAVLAWGVLAKEAAPPAWVPQAGATALTAEPGRASFGATFQLGRAAAYLEILERSSGLIAAQAGQLGQVLGALEPALRAALGGEPVQARLTTFARDLSARLAGAEADPQTLQVRVQVFRTALDEALAAPPARAQAAELGRLVQELTASSVAEARQVPALLAPGPEPLARLRALLTSAVGLGTDERKAALEALDALAAARADIPTPERAGRIRAALERLDGSLRRAR